MTADIWNSRTEPKTTPTTAASTRRRRTATHPTIGSTANSSGCIPSRLPAMTSANGPAPTSSAEMIPAASTWAALPYWEENWENAFPSSSHPRPAHSTNANTAGSTTIVASCRPNGAPARHAARPCEPGGRCRRVDITNTPSATPAAAGNASYRVR